MKSAVSDAENAEKATIQYPTPYYCAILKFVPINFSTMSFLKTVPSATALFEKVNRTIFQSKRRRLVFITGVIIYIQNDTYKN